MNNLPQQTSVTHVDWGRFVLDGGAMFGIVPRPLWAKRIPPDEDNGIRLALRSLVMQTAELNVLVDCGLWPCFAPKLSKTVYKCEQPDMDVSLREQTGLSPEEITDIIVTHLHFDHAGGFARLEKGALTPRFPNARLHVQKVQLEWAREGSRKDRGSYVRELVELVAGHALLTIHDGAWSLTPEIHVELAHGHTPNMQLVRLECGPPAIVHTADMVPTSAHVAVPYIMAYDNEPLKTAAEKETFYKRFPDAVYFFQHDPEEPFWTVEETVKGWRRKAPYSLKGLAAEKSGE